MRKVKVDWRELEEAFELGQRGQSTYLDARTGKVLAWTDEATDTVELEGLVDEVAADPARYIEVTLPTDSDAWEQMTAFARGVEDTAARERLEAALAGPDRVSRRFKDALLSLPALGARWFEAEAAWRRRAIVAWLEAEGLEPEPPPPW